MERKECVYVIRKFNGVKFCVTREDYEKSKDDFELCTDSSKEIKEVAKEVKAVRTPAEPKVKAKRTKVKE